MDQKLIRFLLIQYFTISVYLEFTSHCHAHMTTSCKQTPYPEVCEHYVGPPPQTLDGTDGLTFHDLSIKSTIDLTKQLHRLVSDSKRRRFLSKCATSALFDCLELYRDTLLQLNRSTNRHFPSSMDIQTSLSAAIANQETCKNGFFDFNLTSYSTYFPLEMHRNLSKSLSNSLAVTKAAADESSAAAFTEFNKQGHFGGSGRRLLLSGEKFPLWVSYSDRKLLESLETTAKADLVVAKDGSGHYTSVSKAVEAAMRLHRQEKSGNRFVIYVKAGIYNENIEIKRSMKNLMVVGDGIDSTVITGNRNVRDGTTTFQSATFAVTGEGFIGRDITFENTAGPTKHQAVALRSGSDFSVFYRCSFKGYQDTLYIHSNRQFYRNCDIYGTIDFIFGDAAAVLQRCNIFVRRPMSGQKNTVTAHARKDPNENTGIVIHDSIVTAAEDGTAETYLGRPWRMYSRTVFMKCFLGGVVSPVGWLEWSGDFALSTLYYGEYMNSGPGANISDRVKWPGFQVLMTASEASKFTVGNFLAGNSWIPAAGVPFDYGL
ncbi:PREDICTED: probable pectinesterase/pectinesterase inhibitor 6 [Tarenaya hassleriana]|uniref:probable pectinesterase/pectinesterase inhibitor 6 n=1 Tax=Tarenaya hassleriana TaxID=28532 RepID=UPI00053C2610|nr:PREDICTED: probable pectinesterase/pectinesterase inhibitor 6 [Tarenaya hassleriana]